MLSEISQYITTTSLDQVIFFGMGLLLLLFVGGGCYKLNKLLNHMAIVVEDIIEELPPVEPHFSDNEADITSTSTGQKRKAFLSSGGGGGGGGFCPIIESVEDGPVDVFKRRHNRRKKRKHIKVVSNEKKDG